MEQALSAMMAVRFGNLLQILILHRSLQLLLNKFVQAKHVKSIRHLQYLQQYVTTVPSNMYEYCLHFIGTLDVGTYKLPCTFVIRVFHAFSFCPLHFMNLSLIFQPIAAGY